MGLKEEFTQALEGTVEAAKARNYIPTYFMEMLSEHGGVETAKRLVAKSEPQTGHIETQSFKIQKSKLIIDEIDRVLARHYGLTDEELDFIINYDIKYRMGAGLESEEA